MKFQFAWEIKSIDTPNSTIQVEYTRLDTGKKYLSDIKIPVDSNTTLSNYIQRNAPTRVWNSESAIPLSPDVVGLTGNNVTPESLEEVKNDKRLEISNIRYGHETAGIIFAETIANSSIPQSRIISTTRESQALISSAYSSLLNGILTEVDFKTNLGIFIKTDLPKMTEIATKVSEHVQSCFTREKAAYEKIQAATTIEEVNLVTY